MNAEFYKTCDDCRHKIRLQGRKHKKKKYEYVYYYNIHIKNMDEIYLYTKSSIDQEHKNYFYLQNLKEYKPH